MRAAMNLFRIVAALPPDFVIVAAVLALSA